MNELHYSYHRLFELLERKKITYARLKREAKLTKEEQFALENDGRIRVSTIVRICQFLRCDIRDIMEADGELI